MKTENVYEDFSKDKEMFDFSKCSFNSNYYDNSNKLVVCKIKDKTTSATIDEFFTLNPKMYSFLVDDSSEHKKEKGVNKEVFATISHSEYKDVLLNKKFLMNIINRIKTMYRIESKSYK